MTYIYKLNKEIDEIAAHEIALYAINTHDVYKQHVLPIITCSAKKGARRQKFRHAVTHAVYAYNREFGASILLNDGEIAIAADELYDHYLTEFGYVENIDEEQREREEFVS